MFRGSPILRPAVLLLSAAAFTVGGWAVITVDDLPEYVVAGEPLKLSFAVRQHGMTLLNGLRPSVLAEWGKERAVFSAQAAGDGRYLAMVSLPQAGNWTLTVKSGFGNSNRTLAPLAAIVKGSPPPRAVSDVERGQRLFIAKGCVTCHVNSKVASSGEVNVGPDLSEKRYTTGFLSRFLLNPSQVQPPKGPNSMPALGLKEKEIAALIAFINSDAQVSTKVR